MYLHPCPTKTRYARTFREICRQTYLIFCDKSEHFAGGKIVVFAVIFSVKKWRICKIGEKFEK